MNARKSIQLAVKYVQLSFKIAFQYKLDRFLILFAIIIREASNVLVIIFLMQRFVEIRGWNMNDILFLYSFLFISYSVFVLLFTGIRDFEDLVYSGELDQYFLRPQGVFYQALVSKIDIPAALGYGVLGVFLFINTSRGVNITWTASNVVYYAISIISGTIIQLSIFLISAALSFWTIKVTNIRNLVFFSLRKCAAYPLSFFTPLIRSTLIYVVPFAFINYFPALYFLDKDESNLYSSVYFYISPMVCVVLFLMALIFWNKSRKRYAGAGNQQ